jgi:hypothetical protein
MNDLRTSGPICAETVPPLERLRSQLTSRQRRGAPPIEMQICANLKVQAKTLQEATDPDQIRRLRGAMADQAARLAALKGEDHD